MYREIAVLESLSEEKIVQRCSIKKKFLKISQIHRKTPAPRDPGIGVSCEFCEITQNTFYRTPPVAASASNTVKCVQAVKLATLLKRDLCTGVLEPAIHRSSTK